MISHRNFNFLDNCVFGLGSGKAKDNRRGRETGRERQHRARRDGKRGREAKTRRVLFWDWESIKRECYRGSGYPRRGKEKGRGEIGQVGER